MLVHVFAPLSIRSTDRRGFYSKQDRKNAKRSHDGRRCWASVPTSVSRVNESRRSFVVTRVDPRVPGTAIPVAIRIGVRSANPRADCYLGRALFHKSPIVFGKSFITWCIYIYNISSSISMTVKNRRTKFLLLTIIGFRVKERHNFIM